MRAAEALLTAWESRLREHPEAPLVADGERCQWHDRAAVEALRRKLAARLPPDWKPGSLVLMQCDNGAHWLGTALAVWSRGAVLVPIDPLTRVAERERLVKALRPAVLVHEKKIESFGKGRFFRNPVVLGKLTSGSTGVPKALFFAASELLADARQVESAMGIGSGDVNLAAIPFGHSYGLGNLVLPALVEGRPVVCASAVFPHVLVEEGARAGATVLPATPPLLKSLLRTGLSGPLWPALRLVISAGARLEPALARDFFKTFGQRVHNFYGSTESGGIAFDATGEAGEDGWSVGQALPGLHLGKARDGRLIVSSPAVYRFQNRRSFKGLPAVVLADRGEYKPNGDVVLQGRTEKLIKVGARRVDRREIEGVLKALSGVVDCRVLLYPSENAEILGAVIVGTASLAEIRQGAKQSLAAWKVPKRIRLVKAFPLTARGKEDRLAMLELLGSV